MSPDQSERAEREWQAAKAAAAKAWADYVAVFRSDDRAAQLDAAEAYKAAKERRMKAFYARDPKLVKDEQARELEQVRAGTAEPVAEAA